MELPGFATPDSPKADAQLLAMPDGTVKVTLAEHVDPNLPMPDYVIYLSREYGRHVDLQLTIRSGNVVVEENQFGGNRHVMVLPKDTVLIYPGTYILRVLVEGKEVMVKSLTVRPHPALP